MIPKLTTPPRVSTSNGKSLSEEYRPTNPKIAVEIQ